MSFATVTLDLLESFLQNGLVFILTLLGAIPLGLVITFGSMSKFKPLQYLVKTYVWIIRGTPLMLQLFVVMYGERNHILNPPLLAHRQQVVADGQAAHNQALGNGHKQRCIGLCHNSLQALHRKLGARCRG